MAEIILKGQAFKAIAAISREEQERGLMFKLWPPPIMLFPYKKADKRSFWMKNTPSPLDIVFCNDNKIVDIAYGEPMSTKLIHSSVPTNFVVEFPHGTINQIGAKIGDDICIRYSSKEAANFVKNS